MKEFKTFPMTPDSLVERDDGSISYTVKCPFRPCSRQYVLTYKRYSSYYVHKKGARKNQHSSNVKQPKWNYIQIKNHFEKAHSNTTHENVKNIGNFDSTYRDFSKILFLRRQASVPIMISNY